MGLSPTVKTTCAGCGASDSDLAAIQSGHLMCPACRALLGGVQPPRGRGRRRIEFARTLGFDIRDSIPPARLERMLSLHRDVRKYVFEVWREMTGTAPQESGVSVVEAMHFVTWLVTTHRPIAQQIARAERVRTRAAERERLRLIEQLGVPASKVDLRRLKPRLLQDRVYRFVSRELQQQLGSDTCKLGIASNLITGNKK